ncbi:MAG: restriction endonuclease subunit S [Sulfurimonas sp.]|nr:restriction endonuclease subunit S [Sulfurimonas sp.]
MSRYQPYPSYKPSGVQWFGDIPNNWQVLRNKMLFEQTKEVVGSRSDEYTLLSLSKKGVIVRDLENAQGKFPAEFDTYQIVKPNDLVFCLFDIDETPRTVGLSSNTGMITGAYTVFKSKANIDPGYVHYYYLHIDSFKGLKPFYSGLRKTIRPDAFLNIEMPCPSAKEQTAIANFLDRETAKIDTLIEKQLRLIELLKEKRQAVISHAVTRGLDPNVKMKDSGVEWLGEVPEHWGIKKLKYNLHLQTLKVTIDGHNVIALENIESQSGKYVPTESSYQGEDVEFKAGDILFGKLRPYLAKVYRCNSNGVAFGDLLTYRPTDQFDSSFAFYSLLSEAFIRIVDSSTYGAKMPRASSEFINEMLLATPPLLEQIAIAEHLDIQTAKIDTLIEKANRAIELLRERRTALISAAVTGKIDVRGNR